MSRIGAWTGYGAYPGYINVREDGDELVITVRGDPESYEGVYVCSHSPGPGNCTPGGPTCNNYCNMAPEKGEMQDHPLPVTHIKCGETVSMRMPKAELEFIMENLK